MFQQQFQQVQQQQPLFNAVQPAFGGTPTPFTQAGVLPGGYSPAGQSSVSNFSTPQSFASPQGQAYASPGFIQPGFATTPQPVPQEKAIKAIMREFENVFGHVGAAIVVGVIDEAMKEGLTSLSQITREVAERLIQKVGISVSGNAPTGFASLPQVGGMTPAMLGPSPGVFGPGFNPAASTTKVKSKTAEDNEYQCWYKIKSKAGGIETRCTKVACANGQNLICEQHYATKAGKDTQLPQLISSGTRPMTAGQVKASQASMMGYNPSGMYPQGMAMLPPGAMPPPQEETTIDTTQIFGTDLHVIIGKGYVLAADASGKYPVFGLLQIGNQYPGGFAWFDLTDQDKKYLSNAKDPQGNEVFQPIDPRDPGLPQRRHEVAQVILKFINEPQSFIGSIEDPATAQTQLNDALNLVRQALTSRAQPQQNFTMPFGVPQQPQFAQPKPVQQFLPGGGQFVQPSQPSFLPGQSQQSQFMPPTQGSFVPPTQGSFVPPTQSSFVPPTQSSFVPPQATFVPPTQASFVPPTQIQNQSVQPNVVVPQQSAFPSIGTANVEQVTQQVQNMNLQPTNQTPVHPQQPQQQSQMPVFQTTPLPVNNIPNEIPVSGVIPQGPNSTTINTPNQGQVGTPIQNQVQAN